MSTGQGQGIEGESRTARLLNKNATARTARDRGTHPPQPERWQQEAGRYYRNAMLIRAAVAPAVRAGVIEPLSGRIIHVMPSRSIVVSWLLAWTHCRWSELAAISAADICAGRIRELPSSKRGMTRFVMPLPSEIRQILAQGDPDAPLVLCGYETVAADIRRSADRVGVRLPPGARDKTHLFRHLYASWRAHNGIRIEDIATEMGHYSISSTRQYIHDYKGFTVGLT